MADLKDYIEYLYSKLGNMYVFGAQGEKLVRILSRVVEMEENNYKLVDNVLTLLQRRLEEGASIEELEAYDCSGLFMAYAIAHKIFKFDMSANDIWKSIPDKVQVSGVRSGDFLFQGTDSNKTHIGYAVDNEYAIEARGTAYGVVKTRIADRGWKYAARPYWWGEDSKPILTRDLYFEKNSEGYIVIRGDDVRDAQQLLVNKGYNPGSIDGVFGNNTSIATKNFQHDNNLDEDGVIGKNTGTALGFKWEGNY